MIPTTNFSQDKPLALEKETPKKEEKKDELSLESIKKDYDKIFVEHYRVNIEDKKMYPRSAFTLCLDKMSRKGGKTIVKLVKSGKMLIGVSRCRKTDYYNKKEGIAIALKRALDK